MLTIFGKPSRQGGFCDGLTRRDFLTIGGSILGGLTLPQLPTGSQPSFRLMNKVSNGATTKLGIAMPTIAKPMVA